MINGKMKKWSPWYEDQCLQAQYDSIKIAQELDLSFLGSKMLAVDENIILDYVSKITDSKLEPSYYFDHKRALFTDVKNDFWVWKTPKEGAKYIIGGDVARGDGRDYSTLQVLDVHTMEQVAEYQGKIDPDLFADLIYAVGKAYNDAFLVIECNSFGMATTYKLTRRLGYKNVFYSKNIKKIHVRPTDYDDFVVDENQSIPGFQTHMQSKVMVVDAIRRAMRECSVKINSMRTMNEFNTWILEVKSDERVTAQAEAGYNDDLLMALGIALYIRETEYSNIVISKDVTRAMLGSFGISTRPLYNEKSTPERNALEEKEAKEKKPIQTDVFIFKNGSDQGQEDDDLSWLMG